ncbi:MAG: extracellular solute-binding protein, partial [Clostridia bacterium]|nr:extracellular solute-binding protein [Clostridia bacterium]
MMKKALSLILAMVLCLGLLAGCGSSGEETGSVYWLNFKPESDEVLQEIAKMYTDETGVKVTVVTAAFGTYNDTLTAEMDKATPPTLFVVGNDA